MVKSTDNLTYWVMGSHRRPGPREKALYEGDRCPKCGMGKLEYVSDKEGLEYLECSIYPACDFTAYRM